MVDLWQLLVDWVVVDVVRLRYSGMDLPSGWVKGILVWKSGEGKE